MSTTLTYGLKKPVNPDTGATFWSDLEFDITQLDAHTHNGATSAPVVKTQSISSANWGSDLGGGTYKQTITLTGSLLFDSISIQIRLTDSTTDIIHPKIEKLTSTSYYIYTNDNSKSFTALYV